MSSFLSKLTAASHRPTRWLRRGLRVLLWAVLGLWFVLLSLWLILHWAILPNVDRWRPELEARATSWLGSSVRIGALSVRTAGWIPALDLREVTLLDTSGRPALHLPRVTAALSARSLLTFTPRLEQLYLHEPELELRRDAQGQIWVAGQRLRTDSAAEDTRLADWLLRQHEFAIKGGRLRWVDETRSAEPLVLQGVDLLWRNGLRRHELRIDAVPPPGWGERLSLRARVTQPFLARPSDWKRWSGLFYAELPRARVAELRRHINLPFDLAEGDGALRFWAELKQGSLRSADLDLALRAVALRLTPRVQPLQLADLQTRISWSQQPQGTRWQLRGLRFQLQDGEGPAQHWAPSQLTLSLQHPAARGLWQPLAPGSLQGGELQADRLDLGLLAALAERLPLGEALHRELQSRQPQGRVNQLLAQWQGSLDAPTQWRVDASAEGLAWAALPASAPDGRPTLGQPGLQGAALSLNASEQGGQARISLREGHVAWPGLLADEQLPLEQAQLQLQWQRQADSWDVQLRQAKLRSADGHLELDGRWRSARPGDAKRHGQLELNAKLPRLDVRALPRYLPLPLDAGVRRYLAESLQAGEARQVQLTLKGALDDFPFEQGGGVFKVTAKAQGLRYAFVPSHGADERGPAYASPWPALEELNGELSFEGPGMRIRNARTKVGNLEAQVTQAVVAHLGREPVMKIDGSWKGPAQDALQFMRNTPIGGWTGHALDLAQASGPVAGKLALQIPLQHPERTTVQGNVQLAGNELRLRPDLPPFQNVRARADFTEAGLQIPSAQARWLGGELKVEGGSQPDRSLLLRAQGSASAEGLKAATEFGPMVSGLAARLSGLTPYQFQGVWNAQGSELSLQSPLTGLGAGLPEPFAKPAEASWPLQLSWRTDVQRVDRLRIALGPHQGLLERAPGQALRGSLRVGSGPEPSLPEQGLWLNLNLPRIDLDAWRAVLHGLGPQGAGAGVAPSRIALNTPELRVAGRILRDITAGASREMEVAGRPVWRFTLQSQPISGYAEWQEGGSAGQPGQLLARLARLSLPKSEAARADQALDEASGPLPGLDLVVDDFELRGMKLGRLEVKATGAPAGQPWSLAHLGLQHPDATLKAQGAWRPQSHRTELDWQLELANSGSWLANLGLPDTVRGGQGELKGRLSWRGSPLSFDIPNLDGQFSVQLGAGQFLKAQPRAARLLGVLSLQSLPRRLLFDWRDVFADGFAFDDFGGDVQIERGIARSSNLRMRGPQASVLMDGKADLLRETADFKVLMVPDVNAGGASLAYAAINPAVGLTTFLAQLILRRPIAAAGTQQFHITGPWADPKVEKLDKPEIPGAPAAPPASAPSAPK